MFDKDKFRKIWSRFYKPVYRITAFVVAGLFMVLSFPKVDKYNYEYELQRPWRHETVIAPFDIPIFKTDEEIALEEDSVRAFFRPYYHRDSINEDDIRKLLSDRLFKDKYLIAIPVDEDLSSLRWNGRDYILRKILYQQSHCFMTSNEKTRNWALGINCEEKQIAEFGALKPCIWGSDAHSYGQMFCPAEDRFCWIKAVPTFEGLRQIIYEPAERVRIQKCSPNKKDEHQVIDFIRFHDDDFQCKPIYFSEGLTAIIGGKSTGKSILLRHLARDIFLIFFLN